MNDELFNPIIAIFACLILLSMIWKLMLELIAPIRVPYQSLTDIFENLGEQFSEGFTEGRNKDKEHRILEEATPKDIYQAVKILTENGKFRPSTMGLFPDGQVQTDLSGIIGYNYSIQVCVLMEMNVSGLGYIANVEISLYNAERSEVVFKGVYYVDTPTIFRRGLWIVHLLNLTGRMKTDLEARQKEEHEQRFGYVDDGNELPI